MKKLVLKYSLIGMAGVIAAACSDNKEVSGTLQPQPSETVTTIGFSQAPRYAAAGIDDDSDIISINDFDDSSIIYISQLGTTQDPAYTTGNQDNLYQYQWYENEDATWDDEYNFAHVSNPIYWDIVKTLGQVGNSFSFFGMYFPVDQTIKFNVETDQTDIEAFQTSDILGAYHATSALFSRLRFRFFHLMVYLRVTLYVPVYAIENDQSSGYDSDALLTAFLVNPYTAFNINWRANRSSDTEAPLVEIPTSSPRGNIIMYQHPGNDEVTTIDVSNYYNDGSLTQDNVRTYNFSVLLPPQTFNGNIICFRLQTPGQQNGGDGEDKYINYYFQANQLTTQTQDFRFTQGTLQRLTLYLPRHANETVLVSANIVDWTNASTGMTVVEQPEEENPDPGVNP